MSTIKLRVYIESSLLGNPANLTLGRKVNGVANAIWQSRASTALLERNDFGWLQSFQLGLTTEVRGGALISSYMKPKAVAAGQVFDWTNATNPNVIPDATTAPSTFPEGCFGTIRLPSKYKPVVYCSTGSGVFSPVYVDANPAPGIPVHAYMVDNNYVVSWEPFSNADGIYQRTWANPWNLYISPDQSEKWISWGTDPSTQKVQWFAYDSDPGRHDPSKASRT